MLSGGFTSSFRPQMDNTSSCKKQTHFGGQSKPLKRGPPSSPHPPYSTASDDPDPSRPRGCSTWRRDKSYHRANDSRRCVATHRRGRQSFTITDNVAKTPVPEPAEASPADIFESPEPVQDSVVVAESVVVAVASTTTKPVPAVSPPEATVADRPAPQTELGAEQVASSENKNPDENRIFASVVAFDVVGSGKLRFKLDNGQIWRQTGDDDRNIRRKLRNAENIPVEMWQSRTGGYRMRFLTIDRVVRVKRLK